MARRYYGDFRSIDTSNDPKGQSYRVVVFTGYTGQKPYEYETITIPTTPVPTYVGRIPINNTALTMCDAPFILTYEGDTENVYKPYRCSTAAISFKQSNINLDFLNTNGTSTLVVLLKWKNEVQQVGNTMYNRTTGETLRKLVVQHNDFVYYNDFVPEAYDNFCYNVEWIGYATPETFNMNYSHVADTFTLNAQDALSTLQYQKYSWIGDEDTTPVVSFSDMLLNFMQSLGTYRKIYVTDTVKLTADTADILTKLGEQQQNNFDEDGEAANKLDTLAQFLTYLGLTAIPYRNALIITTANAIAEGWNNYHVYELPTNATIVNWPADAATYTAQPNEQLAHNYAITADSYASDGTNISTANVYNSVSAEVDEYEVGELLPDIHDDKKLDEGYYSASRPNIDALNIWRVWESVFYQTIDHSVETKVYKQIVNESDRWSTVEQTDIRNAWLYANNQNSSWILDDGGVQTVPCNGAFPNQFNPSRNIYFITPNLQYTSRAIYDDKNVYSLPMLYMQSKRGLYNSDMWLQITGDWKFYANNLTYKYPYNIEPMDNSNVVPQYCYVWTKIKFGDKWLTSTDASHYSWTDTECFCKLWLYWSSAEQKAHQGASYPFKWTVRGMEGIVVKLPVYGDTVQPATFEVMIDKPLGVGIYLPTSTTLSNFSFRIVSTNYVNSRGRFEDKTTDTNYQSEMNADAIEEYPAIDLKLSSASDKGLNYSETVKISGSTLTATPKVYNTASGVYAVPESHITSNISNQYSTPTINLSMPLHNELKPYSRVTWSKLNGKRFIVNGSETDFELNRQTVTLSEVKASAAITATRTNATHNYRRNRDLIFNDNEVADLNAVTFENDTTISGTFSAPHETLYYTSTDEEMPANITLQPDFDNAMLKISIPNDIDNAVTFSTNANGELLVEL